METETCFWEMRFWETRFWETRFWETRFWETRFRFHVRFPLLESLSVVNSAKMIPPKKDG